MTRHSATGTHPAWELLVRETAATGARGFRRGARTTGPSSRQARWLRSSLLLLCGCGAATPATAGMPAHNIDAGAGGFPVSPVLADAGTADRHTSAAYVCDVDVPPGRRDSDADADFQALVQKVRDEATALSVANFGERAEPAADLLRSLALALASAPGARPEDARGLCVTGESAHTLLLPERKPFEECALIKGGLSEVISVLRRLVRRAELATLSTWVDAAERAVRSIDSESMLTFERAAVQDAFRTTADALTLFAQRQRVAH